MGRAEAVEPGEAFLLGLEALHDGLDGEIGVASGLLQIGLEAHARDRFLHGVLAHLALLDAALELLAVARHAFLQELHAQVVEGDLVPVKRRLHGDLGAHLPRPHYEDALDVVGFHVLSFVVIAQSMGGVRWAHGWAFSKAWAARSTVTSSKRRPTIWRPTGSLSAVKPAGTEQAGCPVMLNG